MEFPVKPRGQLQKENDEKFLKMLKQYKLDNRVSDHHGLYEMLQEYMIENEHLRLVYMHVVWYTVYHREKKRFRYLYVVFVLNHLVQNKT